MIRIEDPADCLAGGRAFATVAEVAAMFDRHSVFWEPLNRLAGYAGAYRDLFANLRQAGLLPDGPQRVLDGGAGAGLLGSEYAAAVTAQTHIHAVDLSARMLARARRNWNPRLGTLSTVTGDVAGLSFPSAHFDAVISAHCLEHTAEPRAAVAELSRVLRPGGLLLLITGRPGPLDALIRMIWRSRQLETCDLFGWMWDFGVTPLGRMRFGHRRHLGHWLSQALLGTKTAPA